MTQSNSDTKKRRQKLSAKTYTAQSSGSVTSQRPPAGTLRTWFIEPFGKVTEPILIVQHDDGDLTIKPTTKEEYINDLAELRTIAKVEAVEGVQGTRMAPPTGKPALAPERS
jgi:hypothetical protein